MVKLGSGSPTKSRMTWPTFALPKALVGIIGIGNEVARTTLRTMVEGGLGPQAILFDGETEKSTASIVVGSVNALVESQVWEVVKCSL